MRYFKIRIEVKIIDNFTAHCEDLSRDYDHNSDYSYKHIRYNETINYNILLPTFIINDKLSGPTDLIHNIPLSGFKIFSKKVFQIIEQLNLDSTMQVFDVNIEYKGVLLDYFACYFGKINDDRYINFRESIFQYRTKNSKSAEYLVLKSFSEYSNKLKQAYANDDKLYKEKLVIQKDTDIDFFD